MKRDPLEHPFVYLEDLPPAFLIEHGLLEVHLVEDLGFLNLLLCDHLACRQQSTLTGLVQRYFICQYGLQQQISY